MLPSWSAVSGPATNVFGSKLANGLIWVATDAKEWAIHRFDPVSGKPIEPSIPLTGPVDRLLLSPDGLSRIHAGFAGYGAQGMAAFNILLQAVKTGLAQSVHNVFLLSLVIILFGLVAVLFLKEIPLRERKKADQYP